MSYAFVVPDSSTLVVVVLILAFAVAGVSAFVVLRSSRAHHAQRLAELHDADFFLTEHFECAERVVRDPATPVVIRNNLQAFSISVGHRDVARAIAKSILFDTNATPTAEQIKRLKTLHDAVRELSRHRMDIVQDFAVSVNSGFVAMMLRWPETRGAALRVMARRTEPTLSLQEHSKTFIMSVPECCTLSDSAPAPEPVAA